MSQQSGQGAPPYSEEQITHWLSFLARGMKEHDQTIFLIEQLQPSWLYHSQITAYFISSRLMGGAALGLISSIIVDINIGLCIGVLSGLIVGVIDVLRFLSDSDREKIHRKSTFEQMTFSVLRVGVPAWLVAWLVGLIYGNSFLALILGWIFSALFAVTFGLRTYQQRFPNDVRTIEALVWSWNRAIKYGIVGLLSGMLTGVVAEFSYRLVVVVPIRSYIHWWLETVVLVGLVGMLCGVIFGGLDSSVLETKTVPNQGIKLSFRNGIFAGVIAGLLIGFVGALSVDSLGELLVSLTGLYRLRGGFSFGLTSGLLMALWYGGLDVIQHFIVRFLLWRAGSLPWDVARFLDYAAEELHFLQKVGGGYIFVHRYLLEHFAAMETDDGGRQTAND